MKKNRTRVGSAPNSGTEIERITVIARKHAEPGAASSLAPWEGEEVTSALAAAEAAHRETERRQAEAEEAARVRDAARAEFLALLPAVREALRGVASQEGDKPPPKLPS